MPARRVLPLILFLLALPLVGPSASASDTPAPSSVTIAGSLQSELGCSGDWQPECATTHLAYDAGDDVWQGTFTVPAGGYEYKAALNNAWDENYGLHAQPNGANIPLNRARRAREVLLRSQDPLGHRNKNSVIAVAPGSFQSELGCPGDWQPDCLRSWLQDPDGDGIYTFETTAIPAGRYEARSRSTKAGTRTTARAACRAARTSRSPFRANGAKVMFRYDPATHVLSISSGHGHDNNVEYDGLAHDSRDSLYRVPFGAVTPNTPVTCGCAPSTTMRPAC